MRGDLDWLNDANLVYKCYLVSKCGLPLKAYQDLSSYKIYMNDVGLLRCMAGLDSSIVLEGNRLFEEFKGSYTENYVMFYVVCWMEMLIIILLIDMR